MKIYDECITRVDELLGERNCNSLPMLSDLLWPDAGKNQLIFRSDMVCELGGGTENALSGTLLTSCADLVSGDEIVLCGEDLGQLHGNAPYARIAMIRVNPDVMGEGNDLYQTIRKIEYTRYHLSPEGFMMRISASSRKESVRVSRAAVQNGLGFEQVGRMFLDAYHKHPAVEAVKLVFITAPDFPYRELDAILARSEDITKALDHLMKNLKMDCHLCNLREICQEVEELCKSEFGEQ